MHIVHAVDPDLRLLAAHRDWPLAGGAVVILLTLAVSAWSVPAAIALVVFYVFGIVLTLRLTAGRVERSAEQVVAHDDGVAVGADTDR